jgi:RHS repeat-associated protein
MSSYTSKGFTGQYGDAVTGLDYYVSRYYDPVSGLFLSADKSEGNAQGLNPYAYVGGNPETETDPTGQFISNGQQTNQNGGEAAYYYNHVYTTITNDGYGTSWMLDGHFSYNDGSISIDHFTARMENLYGGYNDLTDANNSPGAKFARVTGWTQLQSSWNAPGATTNSRIGAVWQFATTNANNLLQLYLILGGDPEGDGIETALTDACSFTATTNVATTHGEQAIGTLKIGQQVLAYNPTTKKMEYEPILQVWIHQDNDLVDLTITTTTYGPHGATATKTSETIHTNKKHPFFTKEDGFLPVAQLKLGMHVLRADGRYGVITGWKIVPGVKTMYNLTVQQDHTFVVGIGQWVVHNICGPTAGTLGSYHELTELASGTGLQAHHIFQDAMMLNLEGYVSGNAPAILLDVEDHLAATGVQRAMGTPIRYLGRFFGANSASFADATDIAEQALQAADISGDTYTEAMRYATDYFTSRWSPEELDTLRIPLR